jgi:hypothetical protein
MTVPRGTVVYNGCGYRVTTRIRISAKYSLKVVGKA